MKLTQSLLQKLRASKNWFVALPFLAKIIILVVIVGLGWFTTSRLFNKKSQTPQYQTAQVEKGTLVVAVTASGQVSTVNSIAVNTSTSGVVSQVYVQDGQKVRAGEAIARLDLDQTSRQKYLSALAAYESAKANLNSLQVTLFSTNQKLINDAVARNLDVTDPTYIQENAAWLAAEATYKNQRNSIASAYLAYLQSSPLIYAPISGTVTGLTLQPGSGLTSSTTTTTTSQKVASIKTDANPAISVNLTEIDVPKVKIGDKATVTFDALTDKTFTGKVVSVDTVGSVSSGVVSYPAVITLDTSSVDILPNMSATVKIIIDTQTDVLLVPSTAVQTRADQSTVRVMKNKQTQTVDVAVGESSDTQTVITSGLDEGQVVVTGETTSTPRTNNQTTSPFGGIRGFGAGGAVRVGR